MYANNKMSWWLYMVGLLVVFATHIYMLSYGLTPDQMTGHAGLNLVAGVLLVAGWLSRKA
ncbi:MAG: hypothetical protein HY225_03235 [Candidatus Vogelbacteria bacterium]|nr:hypothetical protein [Candidatus Vogelbacteria bacterium]